VCQCTNISEILFRSCPESFELFGARLSQSWLVKDLIVLRISLREAGLLWSIIGVNANRLGITAILINNAD